MRLSLDHVKNWFTSSGDVSWLYQIGATNVESYAYLNKTGSELCSISKSLRKILNKYDPLTLSWVVPLWNRNKCVFPDDQKKDIKDTASLLFC